MTDEPGSPAGLDGRGTRGPTAILIVLMLSASSYAILQAFVVPALPTLQKEFGASQSGAGWIFTAFLLTTCVATPLAGRLGDILGKKRVLLGTLVALAVGTLLAALATSLVVMIVARAIQGLGGAVFPLAFGIVRDAFPARRMQAGLAAVSAILGIGGVVGLVSAGPIIDHLSYHWLFWIPLAACLLAIPLVIQVVPESRVRAPGRVSWIAAALLSSWLVALLLAISKAPDWGWTSTRTAGLALAAVGVAVAWVRYESRSAHPLVSITTMRLKGIWTTNSSSFLIGWAMFTGWILVPLYVQAADGAGYGFGSSVTSAGLFLVPWSVGVILGSPVSARMSRLLGAKWPLATGSVLGAVGFGGLWLVNEHPWEILVSTGVLGVGVGLAFASMPNLIVAAVPPTETSIATGTNIIARLIGGVIGTQVALSIVASHVTGAGRAAERGYLIAFVVAIVLLIAAAALALLAPATAGRQRRLPVTVAPAAE